MKGKYILKKTVSESARSLLEAMICLDVEKRITIKDILQHVWLLDTKPQDQVKIFNLAEEQVLQKEFYFIENDSDWPEAILDMIDKEDHDELFIFGNGDYGVQNL